MTKNNTTEWEDKWEEQYGWLKQSYVKGAQLHDHTGVKAFIHRAITQARLQERKDTLERCLEIGEREIVEGFFAFESAINEEINKSKV